MSTELDHLLTTDDQIFQNYFALTHDYLPPSVPCRENELKEYLSLTKWILKGEKVENVYIYGETGSGKTVVVRKALELIRNKAQNSSVPLKIGYVKCTESPIKTIYNLCKNLNLQVHYPGFSFYHYLDSILENAQVPTLLVLDEFDKLNVSEKGWKILHPFSRHPHISTTIISIRHDLCQFLPRDTFDSFRPIRTFFRTYNEEELFTICGFRAKLAFKETAYTSNTVKTCAGEAFLRPASARFAIDMLRIAGEFARDLGAKTIVKECLTKAPRRVEELEIERMLFNLPFHCKLLLISVFNCKKRNQVLQRDIIFRDFNKRLKDCGKTPVTKRTFNVYVQGMSHKKLLSTIRRGRGKGRGTTWFIKEGFYDFEMLIPILTKSPDLKPFILQ